MDRQFIDKTINQFLGQLRESGYHLKMDFTNAPDHEKINFRKGVESQLGFILKQNKNVFLSAQQQEELLNELLSEITGFGPLDKLLNDPVIAEIMINGPKEVYVEKNGKIEPCDVGFRDREHLDYFIEKILNSSGKRLTQLEPYVDISLKDGSRVNIVRSSLATDSAKVTIRKFSKHITKIEDLIDLGSLDHNAAKFLAACAASKLNILISGGASTGKTTLLNVLINFIPPEERVVIIEDTREIRSSRKNTIFLETKTPNMEGKGAVTMRDLVKNSLHMRPDRIIVGEVRSSEVLDMIQAMNSGHEGSLSTVHANSALETLDRLEMIVLMENANISSNVAKKYLIRAFDLIIHLTRVPDGSRRVSRISEVLKREEYSFQDIFIFDEMTGKLTFTGKIPEFYRKLNAQGKSSIEEKPFIFK
ncbi:MAG: CpaF family protein [Candidatus Omnitrophica bacterium]|nr:CpaF family protein [Candidatus Omnitrophota bacterium]